MEIKRLSTIHEAEFLKFLAFYGTTNRIHGCPTNGTFASIVKSLAARGCIGEFFLCAPLSTSRFPQVWWLLVAQPGKMDTPPAVPALQLNFLTEKVQYL